MRAFLLKIKWARIVCSLRECLPPATKHRSLYAAYRQLRNICKLKYDHIYIHLFHLTSLGAGKFLVDNYMQALDILKTETPLRATMKQHGITDPLLFNTWLAEEKEYLSNLTSEPLEETLEMEYYGRLVELSECQYVFFRLFDEVSLNGLQKESQSRNAEPFPQYISQQYSSA